MKNIHTHTDGDEVRIAISGGFVFSIHKLFRDSYRNKRPEMRYTVDLSAVSHLDSSALGMLLLLREHAGGEASDVAIINCAPKIEKLLEIAQFNRLFQIQARRWEPQVREEETSSQAE
ncbi:MAG: STAS domain-containing protein [Magnetococcales bacterium]|nr:STAS domain-containing protein [Magnetococcales bacterium]